MMDAVFTIVTKSYLPQARTLGDSIRRLHPGLDFHIVLADEAEGRVDLAREKYPVTAVGDMDLPAFRDLAFKYDLVELCTSIKPFVFDHLFETRGYAKIVYFDPDIYVYSRLDPVFEILDAHFVALTPHLTEIELVEGGTKPDDDYLRCGVFNLGFIALSGGRKGRQLVAWWKARTGTRGYFDFADGLFVDQKWADFIPCFDDGGVRIVRHPGFNVAHWNMHQREITGGPDGYRVNGQDLLFFHFSGFNPENPEAITRPHGKGPVSLEGRPAYRELFRAYRDSLLANRNEPGCDSYAYAAFDNGVRIYGFQRRLYRRLTESGYVYPDPFATGPGTFYDLLRRNRMLIKGRAAAGEFRKTDVSGAERKLKLLKRLLRTAKRVLGIRSYHLLLRVLGALSRPEEQAFLLDSLDADLPLRFR